MVLNVSDFDSQGTFTDARVTLVVTAGEWEGSAAEHPIEHMQAYAGNSGPRPAELRAGAGPDFLGHCLPFALVRLPL